MDRLEALKCIYERSDDKIIVCDKKLFIIWKNKTERPERLNIENMKVARNTCITLPIAEVTVCRYDVDGLHLTMRITPIFNEGFTEYYLIQCFDELEMDRMAMQSMLKDRIRNDLECVRFETGSMLNMLNHKQEEQSGLSYEEYLALDKRMRGRLINILSSTSNYEEVSIYLGENVKSEYLFMSAVLDDLADRIKIRAERQGYDFSCEVRSMVHILMNRSRFEAAVSNLLVNAFMYNHKPKKKCVIELSANSENVVLTVTDNGDGISEDKLALLQKPFDYYSDEDLNESLGLTVARLYCMHFGGTLEIESELGIYTKVKMIFRSPDKGIGRDFRQYLPPINSSLDSTGCILGKCFGYFEDNDNEI